MRPVLLHPEAECGIPTFSQHSLADRWCPWQGEEGGDAAFKNDRNRFSDTFHFRLPITLRLRQAVAGVRRRFKVPQRPRWELVWVR